MSAVSDPFDALMDRLAAVAVEAVQAPESAVQVYWLCCISAMLQDNPQCHLPLQALLQPECHARSLDEWAHPLAPAALVHLLQAGDLLVGVDCARLPKRAPLIWESLLLGRGSAVSVRQVYQPYVADIQEQTSRLWPATRRLYGVQPDALQRVPAEVARGAVLFDAGFYFACHEYFETLWGRTGDVASDLYQGLIQVAVALRHLESHNVRGAITLLHNGVGRLRRYPTPYKGLALARFLVEVASLLDDLETLPDVAQYQFDPTRVPRLLNDME